MKRLKFIVMLVLALTGCAVGSQETFSLVTDAGSVEPARPSCGLACGVVSLPGSDAPVDCGNCEAFPNSTCGNNGHPNVCGSECVPHKNPVACNMLLMGNCFQPGQLLEYSNDCKDSSIITQDNCMLWSIPDNGMPALETGYFQCCLPPKTTSLTSDPSCTLSEPPPGMPGPIKK